MQNTVLVCRESRRQALKGLERIARESMIAWSMGIGLHIGQCVCLSFSASLIPSSTHSSIYLSVHLISYFSGYNFLVIFLCLLFHCSASLPCLVTRRYSILLFHSHDFRCLYHTLSVSFWNHTRHPLTLSSIAPFLNYFYRSFLDYQESCLLIFSQNTILPQKTVLVHFPEHPPQLAITCVGAY